MQIRCYAELKRSLPLPDHSPIEAVATSQFWNLSAAFSQCPCGVGTPNRYTYHTAGHSAIYHSGFPVGVKEKAREEVNEVDRPCASQVERDMQSLRLDASGIGRAASAMCSRREVRSCRNGGRNAQRSKLVECWAKSISLAMQRHGDCAQLRTCRMLPGQSSRWRMPADFHRWVGSRRREQ